MFKAHIVQFSVLEAGVREETQSVVYNFDCRQHTSVSNNNYTWRFKSSGIWYHFNWWTATNILEEFLVFTCRVFKVPNMFIKLYLLRLKVYNLWKGEWHYN